jgi:hypothetical protein
MLNVDHPTFFKLPDGEIITGVIYKGTPEDPRPITHDKATFQALAAVYQVKEHLPGSLRLAADKFVEAALEHLVREHGKELMIFIRPSNWGRDDHPPGNR